jgi:hypothetical protein
MMGPKAGPRWPQKGDRRGRARQSARSERASGGRSGVDGASWHAGGALPAASRAPDPAAVGAAAADARRGGAAAPGGLGTRGAAQGGER